MSLIDPKKSSAPAAKPSCPLCASITSARFHCDRSRSYWRCAECRLAFVAPEDLPDSAAEKAEYDLHRNEVNDPGYRQFLSQLTEPLLERLRPAQTGIDFGCGSGPALAEMLREGGHKVALYDPFYHADPQALEPQYDFLCATEVVEHFHRPARDFALLFNLVKPGGWLGLMTWLLAPKRDFGQWSYIRDLTHVSFFSRPTLEFLAREYHSELQILSDRVFLFRKT